MEPRIAPRSSRLQVLTGRCLTVLAGIFLAMDGVMRLVQPGPVIATTAQLGWPTDPTTMIALGVTLLTCTALYLIPATAVLGALLLTGYLGGTVATHVRVGSPWMTHTLFGVYVGLFVWGGLFLRDPRLRALLPFSRGPVSAAADRGMGQQDGTP